jgi:hypothetical protein
MPHLIWRMGGRLAVGGGGTSAVSCSCSELYGTLSLYAAQIEGELRAVSFDSALRFLSCNSQYFLFSQFFKKLKSSFFETMPSALESILLNLENTCNNRFTTMARM